MASQAELIEQLQAMNPSQLVGRLATTEGRTQLSDLDRAAGANCKIIAAAIAAVPASEFAGREDLQEIFDDFLGTRHPDILAAISEKICEFDIDQTNAHPWLREWAVDQQYGKTKSSIHNSKESFTKISDHLREVDVRTKARSFFGKDIEGISHQDFLEEITAMDPEALLEKLASPQGLAELQIIDGRNNSYCTLVAAAISTVPVEMFATRTDLKEMTEGLITRFKHHETLTALADKICEMNVDQTNQHPWIRDFTLDRNVRDIYQSSEQLNKISTHLQTVNAFNTAAVFVGKPVAGISRADFEAEIKSMDPTEILAGLSDPARRQALSNMGARSQDGGKLVALAITQVPAESWPQGPELVETFSGLMQTRNPTVLAAIVAKIEEFPDATLLAQDDKSNQYWNRLVEWGFSSDVVSASSASTSHNPVVKAIQDVTGAARDRANQESFFGADPASPLVTAPPFGNR